MISTSWAYYNETDKYTRLPCVDVKEKESILSKLSVNTE